MNMPKLNSKGSLQYETGFLAISVFDNEEKILAYHVIYPTSRGYQVVKSIRKDAVLNSSYTELIAKANDAFRIEPCLTEPTDMTIQPSSANILRSYLAFYFYERFNTPGASRLEKFINAVDKLKEMVEESFLKEENIPDPRTIADRLNIP
ncbi:MAG: hypothetical protein P9L98_04575 [Candidatus Kaelpia imicola]|nr:hypothetical protein [Candidatus Kaelpia imicola]